MKVLILASVASMIEQFNMQNIILLQEQGYTVDVACNFMVGNNLSKEKINDLLYLLKEKNVNAFQIDFDRNVFNLFADFRSLIQVKNVVKGLSPSLNNAREIDKEKYVLIHSHSPIGGMVGRFISKRFHIFSIYTAHGFHFYKGGPKKNWIIFYPIEKFLSSWTDILITINKEDYQLAKNKFSAKKTYYIPGIGIDCQKYNLDNFDMRKYREKLGIKMNDYMILSVGELNKNKNHELVIRTVAEMKNSSIHYFIAGIGKNKDYYENLSKQLHIHKQIHLLGYRKDIPELNHSADVFAFPSIREGLGIAAIESLACGTPVCGMNTRGINEYVINGKTGYLFDNTIESCKSALEEARNVKCKMSKFCIQISEKFSQERVNKIMKEIYGQIPRSPY